MGGGLLQLTLEGQMNIPLFYNPQISFFNFAYKKHTNFAIENIEQSFNSKSASITNMHSSTTENTVFLGENGNLDLLSNLYLIFKLPNIYSDDKYKFKWVENIGALIIKKAEFWINETMIDQITGEWIVVWNELTLPVKDGFNNMTGNIPELSNPRKKETIIRIKNNIISDFDYPSSDENNPSIKERFLTIPLPFWFSKNYSLALPILKFCSKNNIKLKIIFEDIEKLYTVYSDIYNMNISSDYYNTLHKKNIKFTDFIKTGDDKLNISIDATYIVLDCYERQLILNKATNQYLFETISIKDSAFTSSGDSVKIIDINSQLMVKEIIWTLTRLDNINKFNDILNYTYSIPKNNESGIMKKAEIVWGRTQGSRMQEKDAYFFNNIQPYQHHSIIPMQGIYCYSFSLFPEKWFPSGCYNASRIETQLKITLNNYVPSLIDDIYMKKFKEIYKMSDNNNDIIIKVYIVEYNILTITSGEVGLTFSN